jgi:hypothetical protein
MSGHLRHCPKHSGPGRPMPLPCKHCGPVVCIPVAIPEPPPAATPPPSTMPEVQEATKPIPVSNPDPTAPKKRAGRPRKHQDRRAAHHHKETEPERLAMIVKIMVVVRAALAKPMGPDDGRSAEKQAESQREITRFLTRFRADLRAVQLRHLNIFHKALRGHADSSGRMPGERSGEVPQSGGMSEMEALLARIVDGNYDDLATDRHPNTNTAPEKFVAGEKEKPKKRVLPEDPQEVERLLDLAVEQLGDELWNKVDSLAADLVEELADELWGNKRDEPISRGITSASLVALRAHLREQYCKGESGTTAETANVDRLVALSAPQSMIDAAKAEVSRVESELARNIHHQQLKELMVRIWQEEKDAAKKGKRLERLGKEGKRAHREERLMAQEEQSAAEGWTLEEATKSAGERRRKKDHVETALG